MLFLGWTAFPISIARAATAEVNFSNVPTVFTGFPTVDVTDSQFCCGAGHGFANVPLAELKAELTAASPFTVPGVTGGSYSLRVAIRDEFTFLPAGALPTGTLVHYLATLTVTGTGLAPLLDEDYDPPGGQAFGFVRAIVGNGAGASLTFTTSTPRAAGEVQVAPDIPFPIFLTATELIEAQIGTPFPLTYSDYPRGE